MCHIITGKSQVCIVYVHPVLNICERTTKKSSGDLVKACRFWFAQFRQ